MQHDIPRLVGKTPSSTTFYVPSTKEMLQTLFNPHNPKSTLDYVTLACIALQLFLFITLSGWKRTTFFLVLFTTFRAAYNAGLGFLLKWQSDGAYMVKLAQQAGVFDEPLVPVDGEVVLTTYRFKPSARLWIETELASKMGADYDPTKVPIEFKTWLLFRQLVDLILLNDFTAYLCFAFSAMRPILSAESGILLTLFCWTTGLILVVFNIWVKLDAHRVVKDFAWYWGDFFFVIEQSLTFDGVFEMVPHPMYSLGYAGYYGISLISRSYLVFFVSLAAHAAQFAFLVVVENPHIDKTYGVDASSEHSESQGSGTMSPQEIYRHYFRQDLIVFRNFNVLHLFTAVILLYALVFSIFSTETLATLHALAWCIVHHYGSGAILFAQSHSQWWVRKKIKYGGTVRDAFQSWKHLYNLGICMWYWTFILAVARSYDIFNLGPLALLRHTFGVLLIALHVWTAMSVYEVIGDFGWFYGDFFIADYPMRLQYTGIYRFLNNPEKWLGHAAFWGCALIANKPSLYFLASFSQLSSYLFLYFVERPHMRALYGPQVREVAGLEKNVKRPLEHFGWHDLEQRVEAYKTKFLALFLEHKERIAGTVKEVEQRSKRVGRSIVERAETLATEELSSIVDKDAYSVQVDVESMELGQALCVRVKAPSTRSPRDWIGIYRRGSNQSILVSTVSSNDKWLYVPAQTNVDTITFPPSHVPWKSGTFEARYHHNGGHTVLAASKPFEIVVAKVEVVSDVSEMEQHVRRLVQPCYFDASVQSLVQTIQPSDTLPQLKDQHVCTRIATLLDYAFDIELDHTVIRMDATLTNLSTRLIEAHGSLLLYKKQPAIVLFD